ncbi:MAG TPA: hypothetical protein VLT88_03755 [Desulfosarcina sp.]|nr:hypothetical protein [Desulfosarcina sp.]
MSDHLSIMEWITRFLALFVLVALGTSAHGQDTRTAKQLTVLGTAVVHGDNLAGSRQNAVNDALVAAVGQVVVEMLTGETVVRRFQLINEHILAQQDNYVMNYRVLTESVTGSAIRTLVQVDISVDRVSRDLSRLGLAMDGSVYPRILFMLAEKNLGDAGFRYWWGDTRQPHRTISEAAMAETLQSIGFEIVDPPELTAPLGLPRNAADEQMMVLARRLGADVLVAGEGAAATAANTMGGTITAFAAEVQARAFNVQTGRQIGSTRQKSAASGMEAMTAGREALSGAGALAADDLARQIMVAWQQEQDRSALIEVAVEGTGGHIASFVRLRTAISTLSGVKELKMREMSADRAVMAVNYQGSARSLADALLLKTFSGFGIDIYAVTAEAVQIQLIHR